MKIIHGSTHFFNTFDYAKIGQSNGTGLGVGFYFTDSLNLAKIYTKNEGFLYHCNFEVKKVLEIDKKTIKKSQAIKLALHIDKNFEGYFLANYGTLADFIEYEYNTSESDADFISSIIHGFGNTKFILESLYSLFGYNCMISESYDEILKENIKVYVILCTKDLTIEKIESYKKEN